VPEPDPAADPAPVYAGFCDGRDSAGPLWDAAPGEAAAPPT